MNTTVSFELAKLLKEKRITIGGFKYYDNGGLLNHSVGFIYSNSGLVLAPTIADVVMWLYEKYGIWISVNREPESGVFFSSIDKNKCEILFDEGNDYDSPAEAYEAAIEYTLNNLI